MTVGDSVQPGDVVIRKSAAGATPAYVLRAMPGPDQVGCATRPLVTQLAVGYGKHAGVDVWFADGAEAVTAVAHFRGQARRAARALAFSTRTVTPAGLPTWSLPRGRARPSAPQRLARPAGS